MDSPEGTLYAIPHSQACKVSEGKHKDDTLEPQRQCADSNINNANVNALIIVIAIRFAIQGFFATRIQAVSKDERAAPKISASSKHSGTSGNQVNIF